MIEKISKEMNTQSIEVLVPDEQGQSNVADCILRIKAGDVGEDVQRKLLSEAQSLVTKGADVIITGCTEIPSVLSNELVPDFVEFVDPMRILALEIIRITKEGEKS